MQKGYTFESETDTETIAKLAKHIYDKNQNLTFREIVEQVIQQLVSILCGLGRGRDLVGLCSMLGGEGDKYW